MFKYIQIITLLSLLTSSYTFGAGAGQNVIQKRKDSGAGFDEEAFTLSASKIIGRNAAGTLAGLTLGDGLTLTGNTLTAAGGITSIGLSVPTGLTVTGSPLTANGTLAITTTLSGVLKGTGSGFTAAVAGTDYQTPLTFSTGLTNSSGTITVNTSQNIATLSNLTGNGFVKTSGSIGTLSIDTSTYLTTTGDGSALTGILPGQIAGLGTAQSPNLFWAGPASGSAAAPTFRAMVDADVPSALTGKSYNGLTVSTTTGTLQIEDGIVAHVTAAFGTAAFMDYGTDEFHLLQWAANANVAAPTQIVVATELNALKRVAVLPVGLGGTNASTAAGAINNLLPSQSGSTNKYLRSDGTNVDWSAVSLEDSVQGNLAVTSLNSGTNATNLTFWRGDGGWFSALQGPAGNDTEVQFNDGGVLAGDNGMTFNKTTNALTLNGVSYASSFDGSTSSNSLAKVRTLRLLDVGEDATLMIYTGDNQSGDYQIDIGVVNGNRSVVLGGNLVLGGTLGTDGAVTFSGSFATILRITAATDVTLPTSGTLYGTKTGSITSSQLRTSMTDESGTGVFLTANGDGSGLTGIASAIADGALSAAKISGVAVVGGTGSVDNAVLRANGTGGGTAQASALVVSDATTYSSQVYVQTKPDDGSTTNMHLVLSPKGSGALIAGPPPDGTSTGGNNRGTGSIDLQTSRSSASQVAAGTNSVAIGVGNTTAGATAAIAIGDGNSASGQWSVAIGISNSAGANGNVAIGYSNNTPIYGNGNVYLGYQQFLDTARTGYNNFAGTHATGINSVIRHDTASYHSFGAWVYQDPSQVETVCLRVATTNATTTEALTAQNARRFEVPSGILFDCDIKIHARSDAGTCASYWRRCLIANEGGATALIGSVETIGTDIEEDAAWDVSITADNTNDSLKVEVTGTAATNIRWTCIIRSAETKY